MSSAAVTNTMLIMMVGRAADLRAVNCKTQIVVGGVFSALIALSMVLEQVRSSPLIWLFLPIMVLPGYLWLHERVIRTCRGK